MPQAAPHDIEWLQSQIGGLYGGIAQLRGELKRALEENEELKKNQRKPKPPKE